MDEFHSPISEIINHGLADTLPFNPNYHFVNGRAYPCPHADDWNDVLFEGVDLTDIRQLNWAGLGLVTLYHSMNLFSRGLYDSHIGMSYLWEVWFLAHFVGGHVLQPLRFLDISWPLQNLYRATNRKTGHLVTLEQVRMGLDGLTEA
ncbi:hypothetical protein LguiA_017077 [Lonicera macranthoides]